MNTYRRVIDFYYKRKKYSMFIDNKDRYYFMSKENNKYSYINIHKYLELGAIFSNPVKIMNFRNGEKFKLSPKVIISGALVLATAGSVSFAPDIYDMLIQRDKAVYSQYSSYENNISNEELAQVDNIKNEFNNKLSFDVVDSDTEFTVDTYEKMDAIKSLFIYDSDYLDLYLDTKKDITIEEFSNIINSNYNISDYYKKIIYEFCEDLITNQPKAERRILYENLKTLKIVECDNVNELAVHSLSYDSLACYLRDENTIYVLKEYEYKKGTWEYQVLYHELCHAARSIWKEEGENTIRIQSGGPNFKSTITDEALNSIFSISLFDYEEKNIAYQLQSNIIKVLVDNMDNYEISDYMNHSLSYFVNKLDEFHNDNNYASVLLETIEAQYDDYHADYITIDQSEFYPIYEYVSDFYYKNRITDETTYEDAKKFTDELISIITYDVPLEYNINTDYFYEYLDIYCQNHNIDIVQGKSR